MKKQQRLFAIVAALALLAACSSISKPPGVDHEIVVKFKSEANVTSMDRMEEQVGLEQVNEVPALNIKVYKVTSQKSVDEAIAACEGKPFVEYAERNFKYRTQK